MKKKRTTRLIAILMLTLMIVSGDVAGSFPQRQSYMVSAEEKVSSTQSVCDTSQSPDEEGGKEAEPLVEEGDGSAPNEEGGKEAEPLAEEENGSAPNEEGGKEAEPLAEEGDGSIPDENQPASPTETNHEEQEPQVFDLSEKEKQTEVSKLGEEIGADNPGGKETHPLSETEGPSQAAEEIVEKPKILENFCQMIEAKEQASLEEVEVFLRIDKQRLTQQKIPAGLISEGVPSNNPSVVFQKAVLYVNGSYGMREIAYAAIIDGSVYYSYKDKPDQGILLVNDQFQDERIILLFETQCHVTYAIDGVGEINPMPKVVKKGKTLTFTILPGAGERIESILANGKPVLIKEENQATITVEEDIDLFILFEPEVTEPEVTEPEVTEPEVTESEVTEPEVTEPEVTEPEVAEPEVTEPEVTEPEVTEPEVTEPEVTEPEVTEPEVTEPEITEEEALLIAENFPAFIKQKTLLENKPIDVLSCKEADLSQGVKVSLLQGSIQENLPKVQENWVFEKAVIKNNETINDQALAYVGWYHDVLYYSFESDPLKGIALNQGEEMILLYQEEYTLTYILEGKGTLENPVEKAKEGEEVLLKAIPEEGYMVEKITYIKEENTVANLRMALFEEERIQGEELLLDENNSALLPVTDNTLVSVVFAPASNMVPFGTPLIEAANLTLKTDYKNPGGNTIGPVVGDPAQLTLVLTIKPATSTATTTKIEVRFPNTHIKPEGIQLPDLPGGLENSKKVSEVGNEIVIEYVINLVGSTETMALEIPVEVKTNQFTTPIGYTMPVVGKVTDALNTEIATKEIDMTFAFVSDGELQNASIIHYGKSAGLVSSAISADGSSSSYDMVGYILPRKGYVRGGKESPTKLGYLTTNKDDLLPVEFSFRTGIARDSGFRLADRHIEKAKIEYTLPDNVQFYFEDNPNWSYNSTTRVASFEYEHPTAVVIRNSSYYSSTSAPDKIRLKLYFGGAPVDQEIVIPTKLYLTPHNQGVGEPIQVAEMDLAFTIIPYKYQDNISITKKTPTDLIWVKDTPAAKKAFDSEDKGIWNITLSNNNTASASLGSADLYRFNITDENLNEHLYLSKLILPPVTTDVIASSTGGNNAGSVSVKVTRENGSSNTLGPFTLGTQQTITLDAIGPATKIEIIANGDTRLKSGKTFTVKVVTKFKDPNTSIIPEDNGEGFKILSNEASVTGNIDSVNGPKVERPYIPISSGNLMRSSITVLSSQSHYSATTGGGYQLANNMLPNQEVTVKFAVHTKMEYVNAYFDFKEIVAVLPPSLEYVPGSGSLTKDAFATTNFTGDGPLTSEPTIVENYKGSGKTALIWAIHPLTYTGGDDPKVPKERPLTGSSNSKVPTHAVYRLNYDVKVTPWAVVGKVSTETFVNATDSTTASMRPNLPQNKTKDIYNILGNGVNSDISLAEHVGTISAASARTLDIKAKGSLDTEYSYAAVTEIGAKGELKYSITNPEDVPLPRFDLVARLPRTDDDEKSEYDMYLDGSVKISKDFEVFYTEIAPEKGESLNTFYLRVRNANGWKSDIADKGKVTGIYITLKTGQTFNESATLTVTLPFTVDDDMSIGNKTAYNRFEMGISKNQGVDYTNLGIASSTASIKVAKFMVEGTVFEDVNEDGLYKTGDTLLNSHSVALVDASGNIVKDNQRNNIETLTDDQGNYALTFYKSGIYKVKAEVKKGMVATKYMPADPLGSNLPQSNSGITDSFTAANTKMSFVKNAGFVYLPIDVKVHKTWENGPATKPNITIHLLYTTTPNLPKGSYEEMLQAGWVSKESVILSGTPSWEHTFEKLPVKDNSGSPYIYWVAEIMDASNVNTGDYTTAVTSTIENSFTITNTYNPGVGSIKAQKQWENGAFGSGINGGNKAPDYSTLNITLTLACDQPGANFTPQTKSLTNQGVTWDNLPVKGIDGTPYTYTITEDLSKMPKTLGIDGVNYDLSGYSLNTTKSSIKNISITKEEETLANVVNTYSVETKKISVTKIWEDYTSTTRPDNLNFKLYRNEETTPVAEINVKADKTNPSLPITPGTPAKTIPYQNYFFGDTPLPLASIKGEIYTYKVVENNDDPINADYAKPTYSGPTPQGTNGEVLVFTVTNKYQSMPVKITLEDETIGGPATEGGAENGFNYKVSYLNFNYHDPSDSTLNTQVNEKPFRLRNNNNNPLVIHSKENASYTVTQEPKENYETKVLVNNIEVTPQQGGPLTVVEKDGLRTYTYNTTLTNQNLSIKFVNRYAPPTVSLEITKEWEDYYGNPFPQDQKPNYEALQIKVEIYQDSALYNTSILDKDGKAVVANVPLTNASGQPYTYTVKEISIGGNSPEEAGYKATVTQGALIPGTEGKEDRIPFTLTNQKQYVPPTGIKDNTFPYVLMSLLALGGIALYFSANRRRRNGV